MHEKNKLSTCAKNSVIHTYTYTPMLMNNQCKNSLQTFSPRNKTKFNLKIFFFFYILKYSSTICDYCGNKIRNKNKTDRTNCRLISICFYIIYNIISSWEWHLRNSRNSQNTFWRKKRNHCNMSHIEMDLAESLFNDQEKYIQKGRLGDSASSL